MAANEFGVQIPAAHSIGDMIDTELSGTPTQYQFPKDRPKYYTTITFDKYSTPRSPGSVGGSWESFKSMLTDVAASMDASNPEANAGSTLRTWLENAQAAISGGADAGLAILPEWLRKNLPHLAAAGQQTESTMVLPLPVGLTDVHKVHWDEKSIIPWLSSLAGQAISEPIIRVGGLFGLAPNFFQTILFDRPEFKRHKLAFKLSPRNFKESTSIRDIIWVLNNAMSPSVEAGGLIFGFPNIVNVKLNPNNGWLFKFKPAIIETLAINYCGGDGKKAFYHDPIMTGPRPGGGGSGNNPPESVEITLHLIEIEYWIKGDFKTSNS